MPNQAQLSTVNGIEHSDINQDGNIDLILASNMYQAEVETRRHDASIGSVLLGDGNGGFSSAPWSQTGFSAQGDVKDLKLFTDNKNNLILILGINNAPVHFFTTKKD